MRVGLKRLVHTEDRAATVLSTQKDVCNSAGKLICDLPECEPLA
jgi:hypothetical protein